MRRPASPLLAVCGVCGGAGASTVSAAVARSAVELGHVLLLDTGGLNAALCLRAGAETSHSVLDVAHVLERDVALAPSVWSARQIGRYELRVIAARPSMDLDDGPLLDPVLAVLRGTLEQSLVVADCGTLQRPAELAVVRAASHVAWVMPDTGYGLARARQLHALTASHVSGRELVLARRDVTAGAASLRALAAFADVCRAPLVRLPAIPEGQPPADAMEISLQAILGVLRR
ncbi:hypothetical protein [Solirubrobacter pauli]|nr:hypothetical protein [Solirubrobacter pauli]